MRAEMLFLLRNGNVISADEQAVAWNSGQLAIKGTLRSLSIPTSDVRAVSLVPLRTGFRNGLAGGLFLSSMILFSPLSTPGYYVGKVRSSSNDVVLPGTSFAAVLLAAGAGVTSAVLAQLTQAGMNTVSLDGSEDEAVWRLLLEDRAPRWHAYGLVSLVSSRQPADWRAEHEKYSFVSTQPVQQYYYSSSTNNEMTDINFGRLLRIAYSVTPSLEVGIGYQGEGVQRFYEQLTYTRPGTPPQPIVQQVWNEARNDLFVVTGEYAIASIGRSLALRGGAGLGLAKGSAQVNNWDNRATTQRVAERSGVGYLVFASLDYHLDRSMSVALVADYSGSTPMRINAQHLQDYDGRSYVDVAAFDLSMNSVGIGVQFGLHW